MKTKKTKETPEQTKAELRNHQLSFARTHHISVPTRYFKVGDRVNVGSLENAYITEIIDDGLIYEIEYDNNGRDAITPRAVNCWKWQDIFPYSSKEDNVDKESFSVEDDVFIRFSNSDIHSLIGMYYHGGIKDDVPYQRDYCWTVEQKQDLIHSLLNNIEIGKFVLINRPYNDREEDKAWYEILDGKQRLNALIEFYEDRFEYKGKKFSELSWTDQRKITGAPMSYAKVENMTEIQKRKYFLKMNVAGVPQSPEHLETVKKQLEELGSK